MENFINEKYKSVWNDYDNYILALATHLDLEIEELEDINECNHGYGNYSYSYEDTEYYCCKEEELHEVVKEYIEQTLWAFTSRFLADFGSLDDMDYDDVENILKPLREQYEESNNAIKALVNWDENADQITEDAISSDGFGHYLNSYDGNGFEVTIMDETYFICQIH